MTLEFFDAALPIEMGGLVPLAAAEPPMEGDTLEAALAQASRAQGRAEGGERPLLDGGDNLLADLWVNPRGSGGVKPLTIDEDSTFAYSGQNVVVTGHRYSYGAAGWTINNDHSPYNSEQPTPPEHAPTPPDLECMDTGQLSPEELLDYKIAEIAAKIAREILERPDHNTIEYGSMIYMDADGVLRHTPITAGGPTWAGMNMTGVSHSQIYGMVHSHPAALYDPERPDFRLFPTPDAAGPNGQGDWAAYDSRVDLMIEALTQQGASAFETEQRHLQFRQYVLGYGSSWLGGPPQYELRGYDRDDRDIATVGQKVSLNLGLCND